MNIDLINLQKGVNAIAAVIKDDEYQQLGKSISISAKDALSAIGSLATDYSLKAKLEIFTKNLENSYFVIRNIDKLTKEDQLLLISFIKDRYISGISIPEDLMIVATISNDYSIRLLAPELMKFLVVAI
ncbi:MAG: hypothetical protein IJA61_04890 [Clostridia bacterium]|nr:hypothetical protein [Clostridia bacterium]